MSNQSALNYRPYLSVLKHLSRKYRHAQADVEMFIEELQSGKTPGTQIPGTKHTVYKVRLKNSDLPKGKSGGYRVIYYIKTADRIILLAIYSKTEQVDIAPEEIRRMIEDYEQPSD